MPRGSQFRNLPRRRIKRTKFDLSHERRLTCDPFYLIPILVEDCIPGDHWKIANELVIRCNPLITPIMHEINCFIHYFFTPYRLLWDDWEDFITGGKDGKFTASLPRLEGIYNPSDMSAGSLYDHLFGHTWTAPGRIIAPLAFPKFAYNTIYNEYYRDQNLQDEIPIEWNNIETKDLHIRCWEKDYFTSMLPWQQRGDAPAFPIQGLLNAQFPAPEVSNQNSMLYPSTENILNGNRLNTYGMLAQPDPVNTGILLNFDIKAGDVFSNYLNRNTINMQNAVTFGVSELRLGFQIQRFLERMARTGSRYTEYLRGIFNAFPRDDRLQRPEYIGGSKSPIIISEVLQTSSTDSTSPQANMAGHGVTADRTFCGSYNVQEHGVLMGILSIMPRSMYQQGLERMWRHSSRFDFYLPEFAHLSEQAVYPDEIFNLTSPPNTILGYQGRFDEYRFRKNTVHGLFRDDLDFWHMGRKFSTHPQLNLDLVRPSLSEIQSLKRVLAVPSEDMFLVSVGNKCHVTRPMPWIAIPGLIDH